MCRDQCLAFKRYLPHPKGEIPAGCYTDDTEMSVANARVLVECRAPYTRRMFADAWVREFASGGYRNGYSGRMQRMLELSYNGGKFLELAGEDSHSTWNGAAMRSVPLGALKTVEQVLTVAELQARITHDTLEGVFSAQAVALMSHFALYNDAPLCILPVYCLENLPVAYSGIFNHVFTSRWPGLPVADVSGRSVAVSTVHAVLDLVVHESSLMGMLKQAITWGGDTDSVCAIAWGIASARHQSERIPVFMMRDLEKGNTGATGLVYLAGVGSRLTEKF